MLGESNKDMVELVTMGVISVGDLRGRRRGRIVRANFLPTSTRAGIPFSWFMAVWPLWRRGGRPVKRDLEICGGRVL